MKKFLELVEENNPEKDIDALTDAKRSLEGLLLQNKIPTKAKIWHDILTVTLPDKRVVTLEVKDVQPPVEDQEGDISADEAIMAAAAIDPEGPAGKAVAARQKKIDASLPEFIKATQKIK